MQPLFTQSQIDGGEFTTEDLVEAINELCEAIDTLKAEVEALKSR